MNKTTLSKKYQVVIPKSVREQMNLRVGERVAVYGVDERRAVLVKHPKDYVAALEGLGKEMWEKLGGADKYIRGERASWQKRSA